MKKIAILILTAVLLFGLCACGEVEKDDKGYLTNLRHGIESGLTQREKITGSTSISAIKEDFTAQIQAKQDAIGSLEEYTFTDPDLKELAERFAAALDSELEGVGYYTQQWSEKYQELYYQKGYCEEAAVIALLTEKYDFQLDGKYSSYQKEYVEVGTAFNQERETVRALEEIAAAAVLKEEDTYTLTCTLKNTTGIDLKEVSVHLLTIDKNGNVVDDSPELFQIWRNGETKVLDPYLFEKTDHYQIRFEFFGDSRTIWVTEPQDVVYEAYDPGAEFILRDELPCEYAYTTFWSNATFQMTDCRVEFSYARDGKNTFIMHISGTKTSDSMGKENSMNIFLKYRLTNEDQSVVYNTGNVMIPELKVGQSCSDVTSYISDVPAGTYYLEFDIA